MKKKVFIVAAFAMIALNACKPEMEVSPEKSSVESKKINDLTIHKFVIDGNDTYVNEVDGKYYFADDVIISPDQFNYLKKLSVSGTSTIERSTIARSFAKTWPDGIIYYRIPDQGALNDAEYELFRTSIDIAMNMISSRTSIQFVERTSQVEYIRFQYSDRVNSSPLGWTSGQPNDINLANYDIPGIIAHEIMHSMGIMHEQCRPDRNLYAIVNTGRANQSALINFNIDPTMAGFGDFDFGSIMMYGPTDFALNSSLPVITRIDGTLYTKQRNNLSNGDYAGINQLYGPANTAQVSTFNIETALGSNINIASSRVANNQVSVPLVLSTETGNNNQRFVLHKTSERGNYIIRSVEDATKVLTISGTANGSAVELRRNTNDNTQKWLLENLGANGYTLTPRNASGLRLEVRGGQTANGTAIVIGASEIINAATGEVAARQRFNLTNVN
ncbi:RICIN domain-containing protein [Elizabethkingia anophelis]|nr:RICIN domain-containing protein [Elizabethkingia anophelis]